MDSFPLSRDVGFFKSLRSDYSTQKLSFFQKAAAVGLSSFTTSILYRWRAGLLSLASRTLYPRQPQQTTSDLHEYQVDVHVVGTTLAQCVYIVWEMWYGLHQIIPVHTQAMVSTLLFHFIHTVTIWMVDWFT